MNSQEPVLYRLFCAWALTDRLRTESVDKSGGNPGIGSGYLSVSTMYRGFQKIVLFVSGVINFLWEAFVNKNFRK